MSIASACKHVNEHMVKKKLGRELSKHTVGSFGGVYAVVGVFLIILSGVIFVIGQRNITGHDIGVAPFLVLSFIFITVGLIVLYRWKKYKGSFLTIYANGFIYYLSGNAFTYFWKDVDYIFQRTDSIRVEGVMTPEKTYVFMKMVNGKKFKFTQNIYLKIDELASNLQSGIVSERLVKVAKQIEKGETISFGVLQVNKEGISRSFRSIKWSDVDSIDQSARRVFINKKGSSLAWSRPFKFQINNLYVFLPLADRIIKKKQTKTSIL